MCPKILITGIRSLENESRKDASERVKKESGMEVEWKKPKNMWSVALLIPSKSHSGQTLTFLGFRSRYVGDCVRRSKFHHWFVPDTFEKA